MSLFDKIFGDPDTNKVTNENRLDWNDLTELKQLDIIQIESSEKPVVIFKHSTRCGISRMVLKNFESRYNLADDEIKPYFLDLLSYRNISNEITARFSVIHQSPQLILIKNGKCQYTASHSDIDADLLKEKIRL
jgi:bacillithiol system protein YtxJ